MDHNDLVFNQPLITCLIGHLPDLLIIWFIWACIFLKSLIFAYTLFIINLFWYLIWTPIFTSIVYLFIFILFANYLFLN